MVLIGCKTDLRKDKEQLRKLRAAQLEPITYMQVSWGSFPTPTPRSPGPWHSCGLWPLHLGALVAFPIAEAKRILIIVILKYC